MAPLRSAMGPVCVRMGHPKNTGSQCCRANTSCTFHASRPRVTSALELAITLKHRKGVINTKTRRICNEATTISTTGVSESEFPSAAMIPFTTKNKVTQSVQKHIMPTTTGGGHSSGARGGSPVMDNCPASQSIRTRDPAGGVPRASGKVRGSRSSSLRGRSCECGGRAPAAPVRARGN